MTALDQLAEPTAWADLGALLHEWVPRQRWFGAKASVDIATEIVDTAVLPGTGHGGVDVLVVLLAVEHGTERDHYHVPLVAAEDDAERAIGACRQVTLGDACADPAGARTLAAATLRTRAQPTTVGSALDGRPLIEQELSPADLPRWIDAEQSNSAAVLGERWFLKVFRRVGDGPNPDVELTAVLTEAGQDTVPTQAGSLAWGTGEEAPSLALLTVYMPDAADAWEQAVADAQAIARGAEPPHGIAEDIADLGGVVGELHATLADRLGAHPVGPETLALWAHGMESQLERVLSDARASADPLVAEVVSRSEEVRGHLRALSTLGDAGRTLRIHGDLHLGQLLRRLDGGWLVLDFEGEPARPLEQRRRPQSAMRDVAGMLRSFDYAAAFQAGEPGPTRAAWRDRMAAAFLTGYEAIAPATLLPVDPADRSALRAAFTLDKAVYELGYELNNRPDWVSIPAGGILRVLRGAAAEVSR